MKKIILISSVILILVIIILILLNLPPKGEKAVLTVKNVESQETIIKKDSNKVFK